MKKDRKAKQASNKITVPWRNAIDLEGGKEIQPGVEKEKSVIERSLRERVKELNCLFGISELIEQHGNSIERILQGVANILPPAWRHPDVACARIVLEEQVFVTDNFTASQWKQTANITMDGRMDGVVEVDYIEEKPPVYEGPFLKEERLLIDAVAERTGRAVERIRAEQQLEIERISLENKNIALREVLARVEEEEEKMGVRICENVEKIIMPVLYALESKVSPVQQGYIRLLKSNLEEITSPFIDSISREFSKLTPVEIQICDLIKSGLSTKEVAQLRGISIATVNRHREHIRKKLGIANRKINLVTYLQSFIVRQERKVFI